MRGILLKWVKFFSTSLLRTLVVMPVLESFYTLKLCFISSLIGVHVRTHNILVF